MNALSAREPQPAPRGIAPAEWDARIKLAACYRMVAKLGMDDLIYNHISMRVPGHDDQFLINPYGLLFDEITASSLVKIDTGGNKLDDTPQAVNVAAFVIHAAIHISNHDAACVLHTHSDASVAVSGQEKGLLPLSQFAMRYQGHTGFHDYEGVALETGERERLVRDLGAHHTLVLRNHGILTVGRTIPEAFILMHYFEKAAKVQLLAQGGLAPGEALVLPAPEATALAERQFTEFAGDILPPGTREWPAFIRMLERTQPDYRL